MISRFMKPGGRRYARRVFAAATLLLVGACVVGAEPTEDGPPPQVVVTEESGLYTVVARFQVPQSPSIALAVLTDYEQIPRFMPGVKTSVVRKRCEGRVVVEQEAVSHMWMFSKRVHLLLNVNEESDAIRFHDFSASSFTRYEGVWRLARVKDETVITYGLRAKPSFTVPDFVLTRILRRDATQMIEGLRAEIAARSR
jgi:ribosome-associated toxin RatA of RatAB toxin-antitoxin module